MGYNPAGQADGRFASYETNIGDGRVITSAYNIPHAKNSKSVIAVFQDNITGEIYLPPRQVPAADNQSLNVWFDVVLTTNQLHVYLLALLGTSDVTAPTVPTVTPGTIGPTSIPVTMSGSTDAVGVAGYDIDVNGTYVGTTYTNTYTVTGLTPATPGYVIGATPFDLARNRGTRGVTGSLTTASTPVGAGTYSAGQTPGNSGPQVQFVTTLNIPAGANRRAYMVCDLTHVNAITVPAGWSTLTCTDASGLTWTRIGCLNIDTGSQGDLTVWEAVVPGTAATTLTITATFNGGGVWPDAGRGFACSFPNVGSRGTVVTVGPLGANATLSRAVTSGTGGNRSVCFIGSSGALAGLTGAVAGVLNTGGNVNGTGDYCSAAELSGGATNTFTTTSSQLQAAIAFDLVPA